MININGIKSFSIGYNEKDFEKVYVGTKSNAGYMISVFGRFYFDSSTKMLLMSGFEFSKNKKDFLSFETKQHFVSFLLSKIEEARKYDSFIFDKENILNGFIILTEEGLLLKDIIE